MHVLGRHVPSRPVTGLCALPEQRAAGNARSVHPCGARDLWTPCLVYIASSHWLHSVMSEKCHPLISSNKCLTSSNRCLTSSNKKLVVTSNSLVCSFTSPPHPLHLESTREGLFLRGEMFRTTTRRQKRRVLDLPGVVPSQGSPRGFFWEPALAWREVTPDLFCL